MAVSGKLRVFVSWSLPLSHNVALILRNWLPRVIQSIDPWVSSEDIERGTYWQQKVEKGLSDAEVGIVIITPANSERPWLNFEAGALTRQIEVANNGIVAPLLINMDESAISGPLTMLNVTKFHKEDIYKLLLTINQRTAIPLTDTTLREEFELKWPQLAQQVDAAIKADPKSEKARDFDPNAALSEILSVVRAIARQTEHDVTDQVAPVRPAGTNDGGSNPPPFLEGDRVLHEAFGEGKVIEVFGDSSISVRFDQGGVPKILHLKYARKLMRRISDPTTTDDGSSG